MSEKEEWLLVVGFIKAQDNVDEIKFAVNKLNEYFKVE